MRVPLLAVLLGLALVPSAFAQGHEHGNLGPTLLAHDGPADGRQFVGNLAHFAAIAHGDDAVPDFHQDVPMRVSLNGRVLFETTPASGHDYDGVNVIDVVFPETGTYVVEALDASGNAVATFGGEVLPAPDLPATIAGPTSIETAMAGEPVVFTYWVAPNATASDAVLAHTDCWFEVLQGGVTLLRTKTHTHEEAQQVEVTFPAAGAYDVRTTCFQAYPSLKATLFAPMVTQDTIMVTAGLPLPAPGSVNDGSSGSPPTDLNAVVLGRTGEDLLLVGTFDPYTIVGPDTLQHLNVLAVDPDTGEPRQHVDFEATLTGPGGGVLFSSTTLHEYDGIYEFATRQSVPGLYTLRVSADAGDWSDLIQMAWLVAPRAAPTSAGLVDLMLAEGDASAGLASDYIFSAAASTGPFAHSEVELRVLGDGPVPFLIAKLHTHEDGTFPFQLALPQGRYQFEADNFPLMPEAVVVRPASFPVDVASAVVSAEDSTSGPSQDAPGLAFLWPVGMLLAAVAVARRR